MPLCRVITDEGLQEVNIWKYKQEFIIHIGRTLGMRDWVRDKCSLHTSIKAEHYVDHDIVVVQPGLGMLT